MQDATMYALGQIARVIWPGAGDLPDATINLLNQPATFLAKATQSKAAAKADQEQLGDLIGKLSDIANPDGGVSQAAQSDFWLGYYHYLSAMDIAKSYGKDELIKAGQALFGDRWQTGLASALGLSDARRIRQWLSGDRPIPTGVRADIAGLLRHRQISISNLIDNLTN